MDTKKELEVLGTQIGIINYFDDDYISLTDMLKSKDGEFFISDWLRNRNTLEFIGIWEEVNNPYFNYGEFAIIKNQSGLNSFKISIKELIEKTKMKGILAKTGRYGGTYAHKDIAFEFGMWISPKFKIYLIKEFQRLKEIEYKNQDWNIKRFLTKINYKIQTDSIKDNLIPKIISDKEKNYMYADEADILNMALFSITAKQWRINNPGSKGNLRDNATLEQLIVLANLESLNAELIRLLIGQVERMEILNDTAISQMKSLLNLSSIKNYNSEIPDTKIPLLD